MGDLYLPLEGESLLLMERREEGGEEGGEDGDEDEGEDKEEEEGEEGGEWRDIFRRVGGEAVGRRS